MTNNQLTLEQAIQHAKERAVALSGPCAAQHEQLATWLHELQERRKAAMDSEPVAWTDEEELRDVNVAGIGYLFGIDREANKFADPRRQIMLYRHAQPAPQLKLVGYLFVSDQGAIAYSPTDWGMPGFRIAGQIFGDIDVELKPATVVPDGIERAAAGIKWEGE